MPEFATSIDIGADPDVVFDHLVTPEGLARWLGRGAEVDPVEGGVFALEVAGTPIRGRVLVIDRPRRFVVSWGVAGSDVFPAGSSTVAFELHAVGDGTRVELRHDGLPADRLAGHASGWANYLPRLATTALGADAGPDAWRPSSPPA